MQIAAAWVAVGLASAALWGGLLEVAAGMGSDARPVDALSGAARALRALEVGAFSAICALLAAVACRTLPRLRQRLEAHPAALPSLFGLAASAALATAFLGATPDLSEVRLSQDPLVERLPRFALALLVALAVAAAGWWSALPLRFLLAAQGGVALLTAVLAWSGAPDPPPREGRPDVFLITVDTLRADHLGCYGYELPTSPELDAFCEESIVYDAAMAAAAATIPSYTSMLSGTLQDRHGVYTNYDKADPEIVTIAERLGQAGYRTAALLEGTFPGSFANVGQGFDLLVQRGITAAAPHFPPSEGLRSVVRGIASFAGERAGRSWSITSHVTEGWLRELPSEVPVFAHIYWPYPHDPYTPPTEFIDSVPPRPDLDPEIRDEVQRYDAEIRFTDVQIGRVLAALRRAGRYEDAWVIFSSDHGEELGRWVEELDQEPGPFFGHSRYLFDSSVRVPLVVKPPRSAGLAPGRFTAVVSTAALPATLLDRLGIGGGEQLVPPLPGLAQGSASGVAYSLARNPSRSFDRASIRRGPWRLIETREPKPGLALLRYLEDGRESPDLSTDRPETTRELLAELRAQHPWDAGDPGEAAAELSERERRMLEELGYVE